MATAEELLQNAAETLSESTAEVCVIDEETRTINVPPGESLFGVTGDKDVERKYFQCPKIVGDNIDLSQHQIYIVYVFTSTQNSTVFPSVGIDKYHCEDVKVSGDNITFSWKLSGNVLATPGFIAFKVMAAKNEGSNLKTKWNTAPAFGTVLITVPDGEEIAEEYPDIINQLFEEMEKVQKIATPEAMKGYVEAYMQEHPVTGGMTEEQEQQLNQNTQDVADLKSANSQLFDIDENIPPSYEIITLYDGTGSESEVYKIEDYIDFICDAPYVLYDGSMEELYNGWGNWASNYPKYPNAVYAKALKTGKVRIIEKAQKQKKMAFPGMYDNTYRLKKQKYYLVTGKGYTFSIIPKQPYYFYIPSNSMSISTITYLGTTGTYTEEEVSTRLHKYVFDENVKEINVTSWVVSNNGYLEGYFYEKELTIPSLKLVEENVDNDFNKILRLKNGVDSRLSNVVYLGELIKNPTGVNYMAWPLGCVKYDETEDKVIILCSCNKTHTTTDEYSGAYIAKVDCKTMIATDPIRLQDTEGNNIPNMSAFGILSDGTYLATANYVLYKSTDRGTTWESLGDLVNSEGETIESLITPISAYRNMEILSNGRIIVGAWSQTEVFSLISDDNGETWETTSMGSIESGNQEPCFCELDNGVIFSIIRKTMSAKYTKANGYMTEPAIMCYSTDYGNTWEQWWESTSIPELSGTPAYIFNHKDEKQIEAFWISRKECNIYHASASYDGALKDGFSKPELIRPTIDQFGKTGAGGDLASDSGYITGCYDKYGRIHIVYYDVMDGDTTNTKTTYKYMIATRNHMSLINDDTISLTNTWSSEKIETELNKIKDMISQSFLKTAILLDGTKGCGCICAIDSKLNLLDIGDGDDSSVLNYEDNNATMKDVPEVSYE